MEASETNESLQKNKKGRQQAVQPLHKHLYNCKNKCKQRENTYA